MTKLHSLLRPVSQALEVQPSALSASARPRYLIVLIPDSLVDTAATARRVRELANLLDRRIRFIGLCRDAALEPSIRRQLLTLSAIARDDRIFTEVKVEMHASWLKALKSNWQPGDRIVCFANQRIGLRRKQLSEVLGSRLNATVYVLSIPVSENHRGSRLLSELLAWSGSLGIIAVFFWLQVNLIRLPQSWSNSLLFYILLLAEAGLIWMWNSIVS